MSHGDAGGLRDEVNGLLVLGLPHLPVEVEGVAYLERSLTGLADCLGFLSLDNQIPEGAAQGCS